MKSKIYRSGSYGFMMTLDKRHAVELGIGIGDTIEQWKHPTMKGVLCIQKVKK